MAELDATLKDDLEKLIASGVERAFRDVGLNQAEVFELRKDLTFLREQRLMCEGLRTKGVWYVASLVILGVVSLLVIGFRGFFHVP